MVALVAGALERQPALRAREDLGWGELLAQVDPTRALERIEREIGPHIDGLNRFLLDYVEAHHVDLLRADEFTR
jgi:predicted DNA-binding transcriptional regulator